MKARGPGWQQRATMQMSEASPLACLVVAADASDPSMRGGDGDGEGAGRMKRWKDVKGGGVRCLAGPIWGGQATRLGEVWSAWGGREGAGATETRERGASNEYERGDESNFSSSPNWNWSVNRPMDEVEVVEAEAVERLPQRREHAAQVPVDDPELGADEEVGAGGDGARAHGVGHGGAENALGAVERRGVEVAVAEAGDMDDGGLLVLQRTRDEPILKPSTGIVWLVLSVTHGMLAAPLSCSI